MKVIKVVKREALFIKISSLGRELATKLVDKYTFKFYEDKACGTCENAHERHNDICDGCAAFKGEYQLAAKVTIGSNKYIKLPCGDLPNLKQYLAKKNIKVKLIDKSPVIRIKPVRFTGILKEFQRGAVDALKEHERGVLKSLPRSGKTVMSSAAICELGLKTIIIASQRDWLVGFLETFIGSKTQKPLTDLNPKRIGFARTLADFEKYDICLVTIQTFYSDKGQFLLKKVRDMFSVAVIDEVHTSAATKYLSCLAKLNVKYAFGLSGTPSRKDGKMVLSNMVLGPVVHTTSVKRLGCTVKLVRTQYSRKLKPNTPWHQIRGPLEKDPKRLKLIAQEAIKDAAAGHLVLIPFTLVIPIKALVATINRLAGKKLAYPFYGAIKKDVRDLTIERARNYKIKIIVGNTKLLSTGINIPRASMLYDVSISNNKPNCEQRVSRILTPYDGKPGPVLKLFLDDLSVRKRCLASEWWSVIQPLFKPSISDVDRNTLLGYFKVGSGQEHDVLHEL